jgi:hypothetical protein
MSAEPDLPAHYALTRGFSELRHEHLEPSSIDINDLFMTMTEGLDEGISICERNISFESKDAGDGNHSPGADPSFSINPAVLPSVLNLPPRVPLHPHATRGLAVPFPPTHPPFVSPQPDERFVPDFMHSHTCKKTLAPEARNRLARLFHSIDFALKELQASRQLLSSTSVDPSIQPGTAGAQASVEGNTSSGLEQLVRLSNGELGRWADPSPFDVRQRGTKPDEPPAHGECFNARDRDAICYGVHRSVAL